MSTSMLDWKSSRGHRTTCIAVSRDHHPMILPYDSYWVIFSPRLLHVCFTFSPLYEGKGYMQEKVTTEQTRYLTSF